MQANILASVLCPPKAIHPAEALAPTQSEHPAMKLDTFSLFPRLPPEIRLMVWEETWPEPRIIEATYAEASVTPQTDDDPAKCVALRMTGRLSTWLQTDVRFSILEDAPLEKCPDPVALWVCRESRAHTLRRFACLLHSKVKTKPFYFRPDHDILWLNADVTDDSLYETELRDHYPNCLDMLQGLRTIQVLLDREPGPTHPHPYRRSTVEPAGFLSVVH